LENGLLRNEREGERKVLEARGETDDGDGLREEGREEKLR